MVRDESRGIEKHHEDYFDTQPCLPASQLAPSPLLWGSRITQHNNSDHREKEGEGETLQTSYELRALSS